MLGTSFPQGASRRLIAAFVLLLLIPAATTVWLGVSLINQDRQLESERQYKQRESNAERVVRELNDLLSALERELGSTEPPGDDGLRMVLGTNSIATYPTIRLLYQPGVLSGDSAPEFAPGEELELIRADLDGAAAVYRRLATAHEAGGVRAGALVRLARVLRKQGKREQALLAYEALGRLPDGQVEGMPADLVALRARCRVFEELQQTDRLRREAALLRDGLLARTWIIDRGTFTQYVAEVDHWLGTRTTVPSTDQSIAEAAAWLWERRGTDGRRVLRLAGADLALLWRSSGNETLALVAGPAFQQRQWSSAIRTASVDGDVQVDFTPAADLSGGGRDVHDAATLRRQSAETGLPWDVIVSSRASASLGANRRLAILIGLGFLVLLVIAGGYVMARAVSRELAVARLQSDFVASVSHEFRTPLTSLRQFTDLLNEGDDLPPDKRHRFYEAQSRATERLQRLVESLLDFRRMEAGTHPYQRQQLPASHLVEGVVGDFRREAAARGFEVDFARAGDDRTIDADPDALSLALWNLLDNAVKYSGDSRHVSVSMAGENGSLEISVRDRGVGVPREEQQEIFRQFVRGAEARRRGIKGTGIGLAMVQHIVRGHGGRVVLDSTPGEGSTFTIVLPASPEHASASRGAAR